MIDDRADDLHSLGDDRSQLRQFFGLFGIVDNEVREIVDAGSYTALRFFIRRKIALIASDEIPTLAAFCALNEREEFMNLIENMKSVADGFAVGATSSIPCEPLSRPTAAEWRNRG